jgi:hypothetical protein
MRAQYNRGGRDKLHTLAPDQDKLQSHATSLGMEETRVTHTVT